MEGQIFSTRRPLNRATITDVCGGDIPIGPSGNTLGTTSLTPPVLAVGRPLMTNNTEAEEPKPFDIETHLAALKRKRELQTLLARPMTFGEFMGAWLRAARQREIENDVICELLRAVRRETASGLSEPTDRRRP
ncbi:hypothetical protein [Aureimonas sp. SK2]|uniref:hypothetical protein n=1 Tax=Aureimonas sp. SK2 TaxID=3015992 RepID=UPI002445248A|nr:hypothetical protein [Aureimonas sp. SK2]